jgi:hypothetical protein
MANLARMPGKAHPLWCPTCHAPPGPDCVSRERTGKQVRLQLKRDLRRDQHED